MKYAKLRIRRLDKVEIFIIPDEVAVTTGDYVIIESEKSGSDHGIILSVYPESPPGIDAAGLPHVIRKVTPEDITQIEGNYRHDEEAFRICSEKITEKGISKMKLLDAEYSFNRTVVTFYYFAEERIDFRELVRELAKIFNCRIEMRQVGRRDEARMMGGVGICGRQLCCSLFLQEFKPIAMRMVKEQNLPLDPAKVSGLCGRLMCCLAYESSCPLVAGGPAIKKEEREKNEEV
ncbi:MAG: regulatory iron-sulfur-containing complex subunit RicT [Candidatus Omnitrophota bacterium]